MSNIKFPVIVFVFLFSGVLFAERGGMGVGPVAQARIVQEHNAITYSEQSNQNDLNDKNLINIAGAGGTGGGGVRDMASFQYQQTSIYAGIESGGGTASAYSGFATSSGKMSRFIRQSSNGSYYFALFELQKYLPIETMETINGDTIATTMMPAIYPISKIHSLVLENGEVLFADDILELLQNDHQNLSSI